MGRLRLVALAVAVAACIKPAPEIACGDLVCPGDAVCLANNTCVPAAQASACDGLADGAACTTAAFDGTCLGGACFAPVCGDGVIEGSEQCDGPVTTTDCVAFGFDLGVPTCTNCVLDLVGTCTRFGWRLVSPAVASDAWTDGTRLAIVRGDMTGLDVVVDGAEVASLDTATALYYHFVGNAQSIVAWGPYGLAALDGSTFTPVDTSALNLSPTGGGNAIQAAALADDGTLHVGLDAVAGCKVYSKTPSGAWQMTFQTADRCDVMVSRGGTTLLATSSMLTSGGSVLQLTGATWSPLFTTAQTVYGLDVHAGLAIAATLADVETFANGNLTIFPTSVGQAVGLDQGVFGGLGLEVYRFLGAEPEAIDAPIGGVVISDGTRMYEVGDGIYEYTGTEYAERGVQSSDVRDVALLDDGTLAMCGADEAFWEQPGNYFVWNMVSITVELTAITGKSVDDFYTADATTVYHVTGGTTATALPITTGTSTIASLWAPQTSAAVAVYVVGSAGLSLAVSATGIATQLDPPVGDVGCDLTHIIGDATMVLASGQCGTAGVVWQLDGNQWSEIYRLPSSPLAAVALDSAGDIFVAGPDGGARSIGGAWTADPDSRGQSISATSASDVWAAGGPAGVVHWDGTGWSRLNVVGAANPHVVATPRTVYFSGTSNPVLVR